MLTLANYVSKSTFIHKNTKIDIPVAIGKDAEIHANSSIGSYTLVNNNTVVYSNTSIGKFCSIARFVEIGVASHPIDFLSTSSFQYNSVLFKHPNNTFKRNIKYDGHPQTIIGNDVWIGAKSIIQSGVKIGHGAIVGALSYVNKDIEPYTIVAGSPARPIKTRFSEEIIQQLLNLNWWDFQPIELKDIQFDNIELAIKQLTQLKNNNILKP